MAQTVKNLPAKQETGVLSLDWEDPLEKEMATHSQNSGLENPHGQRSLAAYSPWGCKELDTTERHHFLFLESAYNAGDPGLIPGLGRSLGEGIGYPL